MDTPAANWSQQHTTARILSQQQRHGRVSPQPGGSVRISTPQLSSELRVAVNRLSRRLRAEKAVDELTDGQTTVLGILSLHGPQTLSQLADHDRVSLPSMNRTVGALFTAGYIDRDAVANDKRKVLLSLTDAGAALVRETRRRRDEWLYRRLAQLTPDERTLLSNAAVILGSLSEK